MIDALFSFHEGWANRKKSHTHRDLAGNTGMSYCGQNIQKICDVRNPRVWLTLALLTSRRIVRLHYGLAFFSVSLSHSRISSPQNMVSLVELGVCIWPFTAACTSIGEWVVNVRSSVCLSEPSFPRHENREGGKSCTYLQCPMNETDISFCGWLFSGEWIQTTPAPLPVRQQ